MLANFVDTTHMTFLITSYFLHSSKFKLSDDRVFQENGFLALQIIFHMTSIYIENGMKALEI